jgi:hypothetical protein
MYIRANQNGAIELISNEPIVDTVHYTGELPEDFNSTFGTGKYLFKGGGFILAADAISILANTWQAKFKDYKQARQAVKNIVIATGIENLNAEDKKLAAEWYALPDSEIKATLPTLAERLQAGGIFDQSSVASRSARLSAVKTLLYNVLSQEDGVKVIGSILQFNFETLYTKLGQEGTQSVNYKGEADSPGLYDFIQSTPEGIAAFGYGMRELGLSPLEGFTVDSLIERLMDILEHGNY